MFESLPTELQVALFYSPIFLTILIVAYLIKKGIDKGWQSVQASSYAWVGSSIAMVFLFYSRTRNGKFDTWVQIIVIIGIFVTNYLSFTNLKGQNSKKKKIS